MIAFFRSFVSQSRQVLPFLKKPYFFIRIFSFISLYLLISACQPETSHPAKPVNEEAHEHAVTKPKLIEEKNQKFEMAVGWIDSEKILYSANQDGKQSLQLAVFNLKTGKQDIFYQSDAPIVNVSISPSKKFVMVHTASSPHKANIDILKIDGTKEYSVVIPSEELDFSWNEYEDGVLLLSSFFEDWSFSCYVLDTNNKAIALLDLPQPFAQWEGKERLLYVDWKKGDPDLRAPLISMNIKNQKKKTVMLDVVHFQKTKDGLMAIQVKSEKPDEAVYQFFDLHKEQISSFSMPLLQALSDSTIPYYSFNDKNNSFYTFIPESDISGEQSEGTFKLIQYNWKTGKETGVLQKMVNAPISCSPNGSWCLYGHQLEKIINVKEKKIFSLLKRGKDA